MTVRTTPTLALIVIALVAPGAARAQKLDKEEKKWLEVARPLMTPDEEKTFRALKDKSDRLEFQKIFWARRDPNLETPENEFQPEYMKAYAEADQFKVPGRLGVETDCGRIFLLLGKPDDVKKEQVGANPAARSPETWTYRDRPGQTFSGGKAEIGLDETCSLPPGARLKEQLDRVAGAKVAQPNLGYKVEKGHIVKLEDQLPKPSAAQALLKTPRQDFPVATQAGYLKVQGGGAALVGLVRGDASGLAVEEVAGKKTVKLVIAANLTTTDGKVAGFVEEPTVAEVKDGHFVASFRISAKPEKHTLRAGALEEKSGKGSVAEIPVDVPNLDTGEMAAASVFVLEGLQEFETPDPRHPYAAFALAKARLIPRFGGVFTKAEEVSFFYQVYDFQPRLDGTVTLDQFMALQEGMSVDRADEILGRPGVLVGAKGGKTENMQWSNPDGSNLSATFQEGVLASKAQAGLKPAHYDAVASVTLMKDGSRKIVAKAADLPFDTPIGGNVVGPIPLAKYEAGKYVVQLKVRDNVAKKDLTQEVPFEVKP